MPLNPVEPRWLFAERAWLEGAWVDDVLLGVAPDGTWASVQPGAVPGAAPRLDGPVLPALVDAHSHAFQRAMAGLAERRAAGARGADDFWTWRERMYGAANRMTPGQMEAVATQLYGELLAGGYGHVCEFHYLHNDLDGRAYAAPLEMPLALVRAARTTGIGLTLLPTLYMRAGFGAAGLREDQRRFASTPDTVLRIAEAVQHLGDAQVNVGLALHSLRAVDAGALREVAAAAKARGWPVHIHVAEQQQEVDDCLAYTRMRPIEWLLAHGHPDARWNLVHATHATAEELAGVHDSGACVVLCPGTEANLGDGVFPLGGYAGTWSIGSDSHVTRSWPHELQLLEYAQRLTSRRRNVAARTREDGSTAAMLFEAALAGGAQAAGRTLGGIKPGNRADFTVLDTGSPALQGIPRDFLLDALVFSSPAADFRATHVAGREVGPPEDVAAGQGFTAAMRALWD